MFVFSNIAEKRLYIVIGNFRPYGQWLVITQLNSPGGSTLQQAQGELCCRCCHIP